MLQQFLGEQGARYAAFLLTAAVLLVVVLLIWLLIRKALGSRLNFSDKPDRRGRPPRLGITESFNVDRDGRRLVIVRRDNFEHLVMIGGPNDVVIETNIVRGERLVGGRNDLRTNEAELNGTLSTTLPRTIVETPSVSAPPAMQAPILTPVQAPLAPAKPVMRPPAPAAPPAPVFPKAAPEIKVPESKPFVPVPMPPVLAAPAAEPVLETVKPELPAAPISEAPKTSLPSARSVAEKARDIARTILPEAPKEASAVPLEPASVKAKPSLTDRLKSGLSFGNKGSKSADPEASVEAAQEAPAAAQSIPKLDSFRSEMEQLTKTTAKPSIPEVTQEVSKAAVPVEKFMPPPPAAAVVPPPPRPAPVAPAIQKPEPVVTTRPEPAPVKPPEVKPVAPKPVSKNPFDSLEDEMAKLLGRAPEGKG